MLARWVERLVNIIEQTVEDSARLMAWKARQTLTRLAIVAVGLGIALLAILGFCVSIFFAFAELPQFGQPALYTGLIMLGLGVVTIITGVNWDTG
jgi:hypothetical protein